MVCHGSKPDYNQEERIDVCFINESEARHLGSQREQAGFCSVLRVRN